MGYDRATPEQISLRCPITGVLASNATAKAEYRRVGASTWIDGGLLYRARLTDMGSLPADLVGKVGESFIGWITDLSVGVTYDVRVRVNQPGVAEQIISGSRATRSLPAAAPVVTKTCTPANFTSVILTLVPGDHLRLSAGSYVLSAPLVSVPSGTEARPIYITAANLGDVTISRNTDVLLVPNSDHVVWERVRFTGSNQDSGINVLSKFCVPSTTRRNKAWTFRYCEMTGFDSAIKCFEPVDDFLVYECLIRGNNTWSATYGDPINQTWDDSGLQFPGSGNAAWANTLSGFGDTFRCHTSLGMRFTAGNYYWRNRVEWGGDNAFEADDAAGNVAAYDNLICNSGDMLSVDGTYGPTGFFRNLCINTTRGPIKVTSKSINTRILNNTFVIGTKSASSAHGLLTPSADGQIALEYRNNLFVYSGPGNLIHWSSPMMQDTWGTNGWTAGGIFINGAGSWSNLAGAKAGNPARFAADVLLPAQPFAEAITLGSNYSTIYAGNPTGALLAGSVARNAGSVIPGITDGYSGTAPDIGAFITGRTAAVYGRSSDVRPVVSGALSSAPSSAPAWLALAAVGTWNIVPTANTCASQDPANDPVANPNYPNQPPWRYTLNGTQQSSGGWSRIMEAWSGACFDTTGGMLHINAAGGHTDYFGNASVRLRLNSAAPTWERYSNPSILPSYSGNESSGRYSDGTPRSGHTYGCPVYVPGLGPVLSNQQAMASSGAQGAGEVVSFNENTGAATYWAASTPGVGAGASSCWDGDLAVVWHRPHGSQPMRKWSHTKSPQHVVVGPTLSWNGATSMVHLRGLGCVLMGNGDDDDGVLRQSVVGGWCVFDTSTGNMHYPSFVGATGAGPAPTLGVWPGKCQPMWDATRRCAYIWDNRTSTTQIVRLTPGANPRTDPWVIDTLTVALSSGIVPTAAQRLGTYGRAWFWRDCVFVVNAVNESVYFFKVG